MKENWLELIFVTVPSVEEGRRILSILVTERLIACGVLQPGAESYFMWEGSVCQSQEAILWLKTLPCQKDLVCSRIKEIHSYETPVVLCQKVQTSSDVLEWATQSIFPESSSEEGEVPESAV